MPEREVAGMSRARRGVVRFKAGRRPTRTAAIEIVAFALASSVIGFGFVVIVGSFFGSEMESRPGSVVAQIGHSALGSLGWGFGVITSVVLACLAAAVGGSIVLDEQSESSAFRRLMGLLAELSAASLAPGIVFAIFSCLSDPAGFGSMLVVAPCFLILCVVAAQVGRFAVPDPVRQLRRAREDREWVDRLSATLAKVRSVSRAKVEVGGGVVLAVPGMLVLGIYMCLGRVGPVEAVCAAPLLMCYCAALLVVAIEWAASMKVARTVVDFIAAWVFLAYFSLTLVSIVVMAAAFAVPFGSAFAVCFAGGFILWWWGSVSVRGEDSWGKGGPVGVASNAGALKFLVRTSTNANRAIAYVESLAVVEEEVDHRGWRERVRGAIWILIGGGHDEWHAESRRRQ